MNATENILAVVLKDIKLHENSHAVQTMERMGLNYSKNYGLGLLKLKSIAKKHAPNHQLATLLREKDIRETKILSFMVEDIEQIEPNSVFQIFEVVNTQELAEQIVLNILEKDEKFYALADKLIHSDKEFEISAGFVLYSRIALLNKKTNDAFFEDFFNRGIELAENDSIFIRKSVARAFRQSALRNKNLKAKVLQAMQKIQQKESRNAAIVYEEVVPLINY